MGWLVLGLKKMKNIDDDVCFILCFLVLFLFYFLVLILIFIKTFLFCIVTIIPSHREMTKIALFNCVLTRGISLLKDKNTLRSV